MTERELQIRRRLRDSFDVYAKKILKVRTKDGAVDALHLNNAQHYIHSRLEEQRKKTGKVRAIILKGRQMGASTYIGGRFYWKVSHRKGVRAYILTHESASTDALFEMTRRYYENCPALVRPSISASNAKELHFDKLDSAYKVGTAGNKSVGRGLTIQYMHASEVGFWPNAAEHAKGILQAVPDSPDTEVILESTANGVGNYFHQQWQKAEAGESEFIAIFVPWFWQDEYRKKCPADFKLTAEESDLKDAYGLDDEQIMFRRVKIAELSVGGLDGKLAFMQEYPMTAAEAFISSGGDSLIKANVVVKARKYKCLASGPLIIGVDPARFGDDNTAIIKRRNRAVYDAVQYSKKDTMEIAGIVARMIKTDKPDQVAIDVGGLGAGVVDRLIELGHEDIIVPINFGGSALDSEKYVNRRSEMWATMGGWLAGDMPVMIPDDDKLHADLCAPNYSYDSNQRLKLEKKEDIKKRLGRSPDIADALALTFNGEPIFKPDLVAAHSGHTVADKTTGY
jgi:hypothetical protein